MPEICVVCNILNSQMMSIIQHPKDIGFKLEFVLGYQAQENDFICYVCYDELLIAFNFKQKCLQSKLNKSEFKTIAEDPPDTLGNNYKKYSPTPSLLEVKMETNFELEESSSVSTSFPDDDNDYSSGYHPKYFKREKSVDITDEVDDGKNLGEIEEAKNYSELKEKLEDSGGAPTSKISKKQIRRQQLYRTR